MPIEILFYSGPHFTHFKPEWVCNKIKSVLAEKELEHVICLGLTYKPDVDDMRESPSLKVYEMLSKCTEIEVSAVDPYVRRSSRINMLSIDALPQENVLFVGLVAHSDFKEMNRGCNFCLDFANVWQ